MIFFDKQTRYGIEINTKLAQECTSCTPSQIVYRSLWDNSKLGYTAIYLFTCFCEILIGSSASESGNIVSLSRGLSDYFPFLVDIEDEKIIRELQQLLDANEASESSMQVSTMKERYK